MTCQKMLSRFLRFGLAGIVGLLSTVLLAQDSDSIEPGRNRVAIRLRDVERVAHVHIPVTYQPQRPPPMVLILHGMGSNGRVVLDHDRWSAVSEKWGFVAVAPDGLPINPGRPANYESNPTAWNSGQLSSRSPRAAVDDVSHMRKLLDEIQERVPYDGKRVFCVGHGNGGEMAFRLAIELSDRFAAVGVVAGTTTVVDPRLRKPLPTLFILGTKDPMTPMEGGDVQLPWGTRKSPPIDKMLATWAKGLGCQGSPKTVSEINEVICQEYSSSTDGVFLRVIKIEGHGHVWPGSRSFQAEDQIGRTTDNLDATDALWSFFANVSPGSGSSVKSK